jgi:hypothetical protein
MDIMDYYSSPDEYWEIVVQEQSDRQDEAADADPEEEELDEE